MKPNYESKYDLDSSQTVGIIKNNTNIEALTPIVTQASNVMTNLSSIITITKSMQIPASWTDTGITGSTLETGTYIVQVDADFAGQGGLWSEKYSGVMSWFSSGTNSGNACNVTLHNSGHADNSGKIQLRTLRTSSGGYLKLQIYSNVAMTAAKNVVFRFRRVL